MRSFAIAAAAVLLTTGCATGFAPRHEGTHLHADIGVVGSRSSASEDGEKLKMSGPGAGFSIALGGAAAPNFIIGGELWMTTVSEPKVTISSMGQSISGTATDSQYNVVGFGPRFTYYLVPANVYFSATPSLTRLTFADTETDEGSSTNMGFGFRGAVGKEWMVGPSWAMGLAGVLQFATNEDREGGPTFGTVGGGVVFSASMN